MRSRSPPTHTHARTQRHDATHATPGEHVYSCVAHIQNSQRDDVDQLVVVLVLLLMPISPPAQQKPFADATVLGCQISKVN